MHPVAKLWLSQIKWSLSLYFEILFIFNTLVYTFKSYWSLKMLKYWDLALFVMILIYDKNKWFEIYEKYGSFIANNLSSERAYMLWLKTLSSKPHLRVRLCAINLAFNKIILILIIILMSLVSKFSSDNWWKFINIVVPVLRWHFQVT